MCIMHVLILLIEAAWIRVFVVFSCVCIMLLAHRNLPMSHGAVSYCIVLSLWMCHCAASHRMHHAVKLAVAFAVA
jgi:hypothetical protein